ncbi:MAG: DinB family protein [Gemmatimonadaceae bacterium]|nr:DinB family protein [Gemmatimonadaceae bacterium]
MQSRELWFNRSFDFTLPISRLPNIIERLRGTPSRLAERTRNLDHNTLIARIENRWSIQEHVGHLIDLEGLWSRRAAQFFAGEASLAPTDLSNRQTDDAQYNTRVLADLLDQFAHARAHFLQQLSDADDVVLARSATHPRLGTPMRLIDLALFVAEHDDHHLATITRLRD